MAKFDDSIYADQTRKFTTRSVRDYTYVFIMWCCDANAMLLRLLKSRKGSKLATTLEEIHVYLKGRGYKSQQQVLEN